MSQGKFQLAPPLLKYESIFFKGSAQLKILFAQPGARVHYTLNGKEPTEKDPVYTKPLLFTKPVTTVKARAFSPSFLPSESASISFIRSGLKYTLAEGSPASDKYKGDGLSTLNDDKGGFTSLSGNTWLGYTTDTVQYLLRLEKKAQVKELLFDFLQSEGSWIFLPEEVEVYYSGTSDNAYQLLGKTSYSFEKAAGSSGCVQTRIRINQPVIAQTLLIKILPLKKIPDWHAAKGEHGWLFIDEIKVY